MLAFSIDYYGIFFGATQSVELFCTYRSAAVAYAVLLLKRENIGLNKIKVSEMGKYFDVLRIICHTEKKEEMESHQNR